MKATLIVEIREPHGQTMELTRTGQVNVLQSVSRYRMAMKSMAKPEQMLRMKIPNESLVKVKD